MKNEKNCFYGSSFSPKINLKIVSKGEHKNNYKNSNLKEKFFFLSKIVNFVKFLKVVSMGVHKNVYKNENLKI